MRDRLEPDVLSSNDNCKPWSYRSKLHRVAIIQAKFSIPAKAGLIESLATNFESRMNLSHSSANEPIPLGSPGIASWEQDPVQMLGKTGTLLAWTFRLLQAVDSLIVDAKLQHGVWVSVGICEDSKEIVSQLPARSHILLVA